MWRGIKERGFDPILVLHKEAEDTRLLTEEEHRNASFLHLPRLKRYQPFTYYLRCISETIRSVDRIVRIIREDGISVVHVNEISDIYGGLAAKVAGAPCVWHIRAHLEQPWLAWLLPRIVQMLATRIIVVSNSVAEHMFLQQGIPPRKVRTIHDPGADPQQFHPGVNGHTVRNEMGIPDDVFLVGMVGKLVGPKGHDVLIRAAPKVLAKFPNTLFVIVGGKLSGRHHSDYAEHLVQLTSTLGLRDRVVFTGFRRDVPSVMAACDVLVHCSTYPDPFPGVVLQGMAVGKPVIATNLGGAREQVGEAGILVPASDSDLLAEAIIGLLGDRERRERLGQLAAQRAAHYSDTSFCEALVSLYREVTSGDDEI